MKRTHDVLFQCMYYVSYKDQIVGTLKRSSVSYQRQCWNSGRVSVYAVSVRSLYTSVHGEGNLVNTRINQFVLSF